MERPIQNNTVEVDEAMLEMGEFITQMIDMEGLIIDMEEKVYMQLENVSLEIPIQLEIQKMNESKVKIGGSPPLYYVETTFLPVFHQLKINIGITEKTEENGDGF